MIQWLRRSLKDKLILRQQRKYFRLLDAETVEYDRWIRGKEAPLLNNSENRRGDTLSIRRIPFAAFTAYAKNRAFVQETAEILLFMAEDGQESSLAEPLISAYFLEHPRVDMVYGDEDVMSPEGIRFVPWFKPDWSPDTFLSGFYFGETAAVRVQALRKLSEKEWEDICSGTKEDERISLYRLCFYLAQKSGGFEKRQDDSESFPVGHISEVLFHSSSNREMNLLYNRGYVKQGKLSGMEPENTSGEEGCPVSVIIPSMDHPEILKRCIESVKRSTALPCEIVVVDNGSGEKTREELAAYLRKEDAVYLYKKMPFNFSAMCNMGAAAAKGQVYLFLNDDVEAPEAVQPDWLLELYRQAVQPYTGAAGIKLLYPDSDRIQHAGIVNERLGPVHQLKFMEDSSTYYYGWNRGKRNVIAVTGACLIVTAKKFAECGGFPEELPVAFNDVDLCFTLHEKGYYNVILQDVFLYHHESVSRGQDEAADRLKRLLGEKDRLYERHTKLYGKDPFYHKYFAGDILDSGFLTGADYECQTEAAAVGAKERDGITKGAREDGCVHISLEFAGTLGEWRGQRSESGECNYYIQGYFFVSGSDNACYNKTILLWNELQNGQKLYTVTPVWKPRKDVEQNLPDQINVGLTGFEAVIKADRLPTGDYRIGILATDRCSGQKLYHMTNRYLHCPAGRK